mgnify:CR=1 FL=1
MIGRVSLALLVAANLLPLVSVVVGLARTRALDVIPVLE